MIALNCNLNNGTAYDVARQLSNDTGTVIIYVDGGTSNLTMERAEAVAEAIWATISLSPIDMDDEDLYPAPAVKCWTVYPTRKAPRQIQKNLELQQYQSGTHPQNRGRHFDRRVHWKRK